MTSMSEHPSEPSEALRNRNRNRSSTQDSTGLDYSTVLHIEEDISSRIRNLLLSRHHHQPPRTPSHSEDDLTEQRRQPRIYGAFDFTSAKSIAKQARLERLQGGRLSLPVNSTPVITSRPLRHPSVSSRSSPSPTDTARDGNDEPSKIPSAVSEGERLDNPRISSVDKAQTDKFAVQSGLTGTSSDQVSQYNTDPCDMSEYLEEGNAFRFPRLVLVDKPAADETIVRSCLFPDLTARKESSRIRGRGPDVLQTVEGDGIVCKSGSSCNDKEHALSSLQSLTLNTKTNDSLQYEMKGIPIDKPRARTDGQTDLSQDSGKNTRSRSLTAHSLTPTGLASIHQADNDAKLISASASQYDAVDHEQTKPTRRISKEIAEIIAQSLSATAARAIPITPDSRVLRHSDESIRAAADQIPLKKTKSYNPSLLSGASKSSARHSLLKSSANSQPVDNGLPVPPVLTPIAVAPPSISSQALSKNLHEPSGTQSRMSFASIPWNETTESPLAALPTPHHHQDVEPSFLTSIRNDQREFIVPENAARNLTDTSEIMEDSVSKASLWNEPPASRRSTISTITTFRDPELSSTSKQYPYSPLINSQLGGNGGESNRSSDNFEVIQLDSNIEELPHARSDVMDLSKEQWPLQQKDITDTDMKVGRGSSSRSYQELPASEGTSSSQEKIGQKHIQWFKDLLTGKDSHGSYQTRLTAMPIRTRSTPNEPAVHRAMTSPLPGNESLPMITTPRTYTPKGPRRSITSAASQTFSKTIMDLEHLLNEALGIARLAVDKEDAPSILGTATELLKSRRKRSSTESVHESLRSFSSTCTDQSDMSITSMTVIPPDVHEIVLQAIAADTVAGDHPSSSLPIDRETTLIPPHSPRQSVIPDANPDYEKETKYEAPSEQEPVKNTISRIFEEQEPTVRTSTAKLDSRTIQTMPPPLENQALSHPIAISSLQGTQIYTIKEAGDDKPFTTPIGSPVLRSKSIQSKRDVREYIKIMHEPPLQPRGSSKRMRQHNESIDVSSRMGTTSAVNFVQSHVGMTPSSSIRSLDGPPDSEIDFTIVPNNVRISNAEASEVRDGIELQELSDTSLPKRHLSGKRMDDYHHLFNLKGRSHVSLKNHKGFSLSRTHRRQPIARDWSRLRKRFVATVACLSTALVGFLVGIYAGEVPAIQYYIADFHHYAILGNVFFFIGLAIPTLYFWPLPLMHGRKPYTLAAMTIAMPLLFPQAIAVSNFRSPFVRYWRIGLLLPRAFMGFTLGFANMNFKSTLLDLFGASLQSSNPHAEMVDESDVRRHGGGMGMWLGIWTWCSIGSIGIGFLVGASIIENLNPAWGFYISIIIIAVVLLLNVVCPEVRRSAFRRSVVEVKTDDNVSRRLARGEVMMHRKSTGPKWWGQEVHQGMLLSQNMLRQQGFLIMALYVAWIYAEIVLIIVLLGSLTSRDYHFKSPQVGASVMAVSIGVFLSIPFSKASIFSRARHHSPKSNSATVGDRVHMSSHVIRRSIFSLVLPFAGIAYTVSSSGPPTPFRIPIIFAGLIGFLSGLAISECHGLIMETYDTSDLQPGMTGRSRGKSGDKSAYKRTNYSSFPRVSSAFAITQGFGFLLAAGSTGVGGVARRHLGQQSATGVMAGILLLLTFLLLGVLIRFKEVQIIPDSRKEQMERWKDARRISMLKKVNPQAMEEDEPWRPLILGNPSGTTRRMSVLELGAMSRWSEIRKKNRLIDKESLEAKHPNLAILDTVRAVVTEQQEQVVDRMSKEMDRIIDKVSRSGSGSRRSNRGLSEAGDLGGNVQVVTTWRKVETIEPAVGDSRGSRRRVSELREEKIV